MFSALGSYLPMLPLKLRVEFDLDVTERLLTKELTAKYSKFQSVDKKSHPLANSRAKIEIRSEFMPFVKVIINIEILVAQKQTSQKFENLSRNFTLS